MICDIIERVNIKKVDKCLDSDKHLDPRYVVLHPNTERLLCHTMHITGPRYRKSFYVIDMLLAIAIRPRHAKRLARELKSEIWGR
jgi:hypothetical protein